MADLVSGWTERDTVHLVQRAGDEVTIRTVPAKWSLFVTGLDDTDRATLARDRRVTGCRADGAYTRVDCRNRWARQDVVEVLERAAAKAPHVRVLEADLSPLRRLLSDVGSLQVHEDPRLGFFDLETDSRQTFDGAREGKARVLSWALCDAAGRHRAGLLEADTDAAERALLRDFFGAIAPYDCLLAWNGDGFDFPVLEKRAEALGLEVRWSRWTWLDHMRVFQKYNMHSDDGGEAKSSFKLDHVATYLLGEGKHDFDASRTWEAWEAGGEERARLLKYNVQDTALLPRIEAKTGFLALHLAVCHVCRIFPDTFSLNATAQGDGFLGRLGTTHGFRWPTRQRYEEGKYPEKFRGAYVMEPTRFGAVEGVHVCDFAGLYPSIMRTWNMSPETKARPGDAGRLVRLPNRETYFRADRPGMFRIALDQLVAKRAEYTNAMKAHAPGTPEHVRFKRLSGAFKIVANSFYGITGSPWSRFFDVEIAEGVTQTGRWLLENVIEEAKGRGLDPFYGDTDSVFVQGEAATMRDLVGAMNASWRERLRPWGITDADPCHVDLDFEKTFRRIVIVSAKRYAGRYLTYKGKAAEPDAPPEVKGLEFKRGDTIRLAREMQSEIVHLLLGEALPTPGQVRAVIDRCRTRVLEGSLELADVVVSQSLTKRVEDYVDRFALDRCVGRGCFHDFGGTDADGPATCPKCGADRARTSVPAHVRVAKLLRDRGEPTGEGSRVSYVIVGSAGRIEAVPASDPGVLERADRCYYWERRIYPATARILEKVYPGDEWGESSGARKQRAVEQRGQTRLDFSNGDRAEEGAPRVRRRKKVGPAPIVVNLVEATDLEDGGAEAFRRRRLLEAVKAAIEAYPGKVPVVVRIIFRNPIDGGKTQRVKVDIPTGLGIATTSEARAALERVVRRPDFLEGLPSDR